MDTFFGFEHIPKLYLHNFQKKYTKVKNKSKSEI